MADNKDLIEEFENVNLDDVKSIKTTLDSVLKWIEEKKHAAKEPLAQTSTAKPWGWVLGLIAAVLVFVALAFAAWQAWKKGREIAKLKHERDKRLEEDRQAKVNAELAKLESERTRYKLESEDIKEDIKEIDKTLEDMEKARLAIHEKIKNVTKWEDIDEIIGGME